MQTINDLIIGKQTPQFNTINDLLIHQSQTDYKLRQQQEKERQAILPPAQVKPSNLDVFKSGIQESVIGKGFTHEKSPFSYQSELGYIENVLPKVQNIPLLGSMTEKRKEKLETEILPEVQRIADIKPQTKGQKAGKFISSLAGDLPLWGAAYANIGSKAATGARALGAGKTATEAARGAAAGLAVAPVESIVQGDTAKEAAFRAGTLATLGAVGDAAVSKAVGLITTKLARGISQSDAIQSAIKEIGVPDGISIQNFENAIKERIGGTTARRTITPEAPEQLALDLTSDIAELPKTKYQSQKVELPEPSIKLDTRPMIKEVADNKTYLTSLGEVNANEYIHANKPRAVVQEVAGKTIEGTDITPNLIKLDLDNLSLNHFQKVIKDFMIDSGINFSKRKDLNILLHLGQNPQEIYRKILGADSIFKGQTDNLFLKTLLDGFNDSKMVIAENNKHFANEIQRMLKLYNVGSVDSEKSALIQAYGEHLLTLDEIKVILPNEWQDIVHADQHFRQIYDNLIDNLNKSIKQMYGHNAEVLAEKLIPKRQDYYRHSLEMGRKFRQVVGVNESPTGLKETGVIGELERTVKKKVQAQRIPSELVGISADLDPRMKWSSIQQRRLTDKTNLSAFEGLLDYINYYNYDTTISPYINMNKALIDQIKHDTKNQNNMNGAIALLEAMNDILQGKQWGLDRLAADMFADRRYLRMADELNAQMRKNQVFLSFSSSLAQLTHLPQIYAVTGEMPFIRATMRMTQKFPTKEGIANLADDPIRNSTFITERYFTKDYLQAFDSVYDKIINKAGKISLGNIDKFGVELGWYSFYEKAVADGLANPTRYADDMAREIFGARGIGEKSLLQSQRTMNHIIPFTLEQMNNFINFGKMMINDPKMWARAIIANHLFNQFTIGVANRKYQFDMVEAIKEGYLNAQDYESDLDKFKAVGYRAAGEILSQLPAIGQGMSAFLPEEDRKKFMGDADPLRYGAGLYTLTPFLSGKPAPEIIADAATLLALPAGGSQVSKTIKGLYSQEQGYYAGDTLVDIIKGKDEDTPQKIRFMMEDDLRNKLKSITFGVWSTDAGKDYLNNKISPLSETQSKQVVNAKDPKKEYDRILDQRLLDNANNLIKQVQKDPTMTDEEKQKYINEIKERFSKGERYPKTLLPLGGK